MDNFVKAIQSLPTRLPPAARGLCVALSGGADSTALTHALVRASLRDLPLRAVHIDHGLHADSGYWAEQCRNFCAGLGVPLDVRRVAVSRTSGRGLEAAARDARYAALADALGDGECLLTAHHADDQLETVLLRLLRGTGIGGLAGIAAEVPFAAGHLMRPLLGVPRTDILAYAARHELDWLEDPANADDALDRNYLRAHVLPVLRRRWPAVATTAGRTARLAREAGELLAQLAAQDGGGAEDVIDLAAFRRVGDARARNLMRDLLRRKRMEMPSELQLREGMSQLLDARVDAQPIMRWPGGQVRRYRDRLYILDFDPDAQAHSLPREMSWPDLERPLVLGGCRGVLRAVSSPDAGMRPPSVALRVGFRRGGETIRAAGDAHHRPLKKLFQSGGVLPWMRAHVPLLYDGQRLIGVADEIVAAEARTTSGGLRIEWDAHQRHREPAARN